MQRSKTIDIYQFQIKYLAEDDRMLLRLNTSAKEEINFLLTRRYTKGLWPFLIKVLESDPSVSKFSQEARESTMAYQHEQTMHSVDYSQEYQQAIESYPLGLEPVLLTQAQIKKNKDGDILLCLYPAKGHGVTIHSLHPLIHCLYQHLPKLSKLAEWELNLPMVNIMSSSGKPDKLN